MNSKKIFLICSLLFIVYVAWYVYQSINEVQKSAQIVTNDSIDLSNIVITKDQPQTIFQNVQLKTQKDFSLVGKLMFKGTGFDPGFNFVMYLAGNKFGTDLISQNGNTHYVGYLDLVTQSTTTKLFSGKMLSWDDKTVLGVFKIFAKDCTNKKGEKTPFSVSITVATETLSGCVSMVR